MALNLTSTCPSASDTSFFTHHGNVPAPLCCRTCGALGAVASASNQWVPIDDTKEGLVVLCMAPERIRSSRIAANVFPKARIVYRVTTQREFKETVNQFYGQEGGPADTGDIGEMLAGLDDEGDGVAVEGGAADEASAAADNELVKLVNKVIIDAYNQGTSDIHIEPYPGKAKTEIRFRKDGSLGPYIEVPASYRAAIAARIKIMCDLDISEKRKPQDGKIKFKKFGPLDIELRVATIPTAGGVEDIVMRILADEGPHAVTYRRIVAESDLTLSAVRNMWQTQEKLVQRGAAHARSFLPCRMFLPALTADLDLVVREGVRRRELHLLVDRASTYVQRAAAVDRSREHFVAGRLVDWQRFTGDGRLVDGTGAADRRDRRRRGDGDDHRHPHARPEQGADGARHGRFWFYGVDGTFAAQALYLDNAEVWRSTDERAEPPEEWMEHVAVVERAAGSQRVVGIFNLTPKDGKADLFDPALAGEWRDAFTGETVKLDALVPLDLKGWRYRVLVR